MSNAPHFDIDVSAFWADPYPALARMRKEAPIAFVPQLNSTVFTRRDDIFTQEKRIDIFSSHQPAGLMNVLMGHNMMRKDGDAHMAERTAMFPAVSPRTVRDTWVRQFQAHGDRILDALGKNDWCPSGLTAIVRDGIVHLSGVITDERSRQAAIVCAENIAGVKQVHDHLCWVDPMSGLYLIAPEDDELAKAG